MIEQILQDSWKEAIKEQFEETGLMGDFSVFDKVDPVDHNLIKHSVNKQTKTIRREIYAEQLEMVRESVKEMRDIICSTMEEGPVRDSFSNYEFTPDDIDEMAQEILRNE